MTARSTVFVLSGPSGSGKHAVLKELTKRDPSLVLTVTATTRPPREGEVQGRDYLFLSREEFIRRIEAGEFVEWADVHGCLYGTLRSELERHLDSGKLVFLQLDVQGMRSLKKAGLDVQTIFLMPPSIEELAARLEKRGTDPPEVIRERLQNALEEMEAREEYDYVVVNDTLPHAVEAIERIIQERAASATRQ